MKYSDYFGFLDLDKIIEFDGGIVKPIDEYCNSKKWIDEYKNADGFIYPPQVEAVNLNLQTHEVESVKPKSKRPASIHRLPASHELTLDISINREDEAGFIIHLIAYIFGTRLQFHDWWHDNRIPIKSTHQCTFTKECTEDFISKAYKSWLSWKENHRKCLIPGSVHNSC